jgi:hypothetical protein
MSRYEVIRDFTDGKDRNKKYKVGESFPQPANKKISPDRLKELSSSNNKLGQPVIREEERKKEQDV